MTVNGSEPQNPLIPAATNETGGGNVIDNMFTGLVTYNQRDRCAGERCGDLHRVHRPAGLGHHHS